MRRYFFINNELHKFLKLIKTENLLVAWNYPREERKWYDYSYVKREHMNAYSLKETSEIIKKSKKFLHEAMRNGLIDRPTGRAYRIEDRRPAGMFWSEDDILNAREKLYALLPKNEYGEPTGRITLISRAELQAKMRDDNSYYVRSTDGSLVKVWKNV